METERITVKKREGMKYQQHTDEPIKVVELSSGDEDEDKTPALKHDSLKATNGISKEDKAIQTDLSWLQKTIGQLVTARMKVYAEAVKNGQIDKKLSPILQRLKQENAELHEKANSLKEKLENMEKKEKKDLKRVAEPVVTETTVTSPPKRTAPTFSPPSRPVFSTESSLSIPQKHITSKIPQHAMRPQHYQIVPAASYPQRFIPPPRGTGNAQQRQQHHQLQQQQSRPIYCYQPTDQFMMIENTNLNPNYAVSTQVVPSNQGLRMASLPSENRIAMQQPPMYNPSSIQGASNVSINSNYRTTRPTNQIVFNNLRIPPISQANQRLPLTISSSNQPLKLSVNQQTVPNIASPFNSLPKLKASISATTNGIILTWDYDIAGDNPDNYKVECYQLFAHQAKNHTSKSQPAKEVKDWKKIGVVNALPLPMACTLTQFATGNVYYFAVVAVDVHGREGELSNICVIRLNLNPCKKRL